MSIENDGGTILQMLTGDVLGPIFPPRDAVKETLGTLIAWSARDLGEHGVKQLHDMMTPNDQAHLMRSGSAHRSKKTYEKETKLEN